jgi:hypothetical protein
LNCKRCVQETEEAERAAAASKRALTTTAETSDETRSCASCQQDLNLDKYNKNQWNKGEGKSKCRACVELALAKEASDMKVAKEGKLEQAKSNVKLANQSGNAHAILKAESELAALEAELVTGLKPVRMSGRGGGRRSSGGRGRGGRR